MKIEITFMANQFILIKHWINIDLNKYKYNFNHLNTLNNIDQFKLLLFFKITIVNKVNKGYNVVTLINTAQSVNDLIKQEVIADIGQYWIKKSHVYNIILDFKKSYLNIYQQKRCKKSQE